MGSATGKASQVLSEGASADQSPALRILARTGFVFMGLAYILINSVVLHKAG